MVVVAFFPLLAFLFLVVLTALFQGTYTSYTANIAPCNKAPPYDKRSRATQARILQQLNEEANQQRQVLRNLKELRSAPVTVLLGFFVAPAYHLLPPVFGSLQFIDRLIRVERVILGVLATLFIFLALALLLYLIIQLYLSL